MDRPNGSGQIMAGVLLGIAGVLMTVGGLVIKVQVYPSLDAGALAMRWNLLVGGSGAIGLAFLLLATGWIIRAISFLPGREDAVSVGEVVTPIADHSEGDGLAVTPDDSMTSLFMMVGGVILVIVLVLSAVAARS